MKFWIYLILFTLFKLTTSAQIQALVHLSQKDTTHSHLALSQESINRKSRFNIPIDSRDYSIELNKFVPISQLTTSARAVNWFNSVYVDIDSSTLSLLKKLPFVDSIEILSIQNKHVQLKSTSKLEYTEIQYGRSYNQLHIHNGQILHDSGWTGKNMKIAVLDAGFTNLDSISSLQKVYRERRVHPIKNIVYNSDSLFGYNYHGTQVMGCMASFVLDTCIGSAPDAEYYLFITEDNRSETKAEEVFWSIGAQMADSLGVDIINSSLGYTTFDDKSTSYSYQDMNGKTTIVSKAAQIACDKGIIVVNSAGNEGAGSWHYISAPADVPDVVSVGAVDNNGVVTNFSGRGYTFNNVIKPTVMSVGSNTLMYYHQGNFHYGNGTSFASPLMAGLIACYWQANPNLSSIDIRKKLISNSSLYTHPNPNYGFGIPNFQLMIENSKLIDSFQYGQLKIYPNPFQNNIIIEYRAFNSSILDSAYIEIYNFDKLIHSSTQSINRGYNQFFVDLSYYPSGIYFLKFKYKTTIIEKKLEKY